MTRRAPARAWTRSGLLATALLLLAGCGASTLPNVHSETERLSLARRQAAKGDYVDAIELLKTYIDNNAGSVEVDHAVYLLGDCYLHIHDWASAAIQFDRLLREFPESDSSASRLVPPRHRVRRPVAPAGLRPGVHGEGDRAVPALPSELSRALVERRCGTRHRPVAHEDRDQAGGTPAISM